MQNDKKLFDSAILFPAEGDHAKVSQYIPLSLRSLPTATTPSPLPEPASNSPREPFPFLISSWNRIPLDIYTVRPPTDYIILKRQVKCHFFGFLIATFS